METVFIILSSQEFDAANHQGLWKEIAQCSNKRVVVVNIPADYVISLIKGKRYRIVDAKKSPRSLSENLSIVRPLLLTRPELMPVCARKIISNQFWSTIKKVIPDVFECQVNMIVYNAFWVKLLHGTHPHMKMGYYLFDEVRLDGDKVHKKQSVDDDYACKNSDIIFTMTKVLAESRASYQKPTVVVGNGASIGINSKPEYHLQKSVAFIGIFRNWIDKELLEKLIKKLPDNLFVFVGPVEDDMRDYFERLLNDNNNTAYFGKVTKQRMSEVYQMVDVVIVPYLQNDFTKATRPIKIVESVIAGTPVVTIPMDGYQPCEFIRFATDVETFSIEIKNMIAHPIDRTSDAHMAFCRENSWENKARLIVESFNNII